MNEVAGKDGAKGGKSSGSTDKHPDSILLDLDSQDIFSHLLDLDVDPSVGLERSDLRDRIIFDAIDAVAGLLSPDLSSSTSVIDIS